MKINFDRLFTTDLRPYRIHLLFGNDPMVQERARSYLLKRYESVREISEKSFLQETSTPSQGSLFPEFRPQATLVTLATDKSLKKLKSLPEKDSYIFLSSTLRTSSSLVKYIQAHPQGLAVGCYASPLLTGEFDYYTKGFELEASQKSALYKNFRQSPSSFYDFIKCYEICHDLQDLNLLESLSKMTPFLPEKPLTSSILTKNRSETSRDLASLAEQKIPILRALVRTFHTLYELKSFSYRKEKLSPPLFFKDEPLYLAAARQWDYSQMRRTLENLLRVETHTKAGNPYLFDYQMFHMEHSEI